MRAAGKVASLSDQEPLLAASAVVLAAGVVRGDPRLTRTGWRMLGGLLVATGIKTVLKRLVYRTRPHVVFDGRPYERRPFGPNAGPGQSFPSGHAAGAAAVARAVAREYPGAAPAAYAGAAFAAVAQVPCAKHYPSDVAVGLVIGLASEAAVNGFVSRFTAATDQLPLGAPTEEVRQSERVPVANRDDEPASSEPCQGRKTMQSSRRM